MAGLRRRYLLEILRRIGPFLVLFGAVYVAISVLFYLFEAPSYSLYTSFYWGITTLSTVGYGDVVPGTTDARLVAMAAMFIQIFLLGYLISVITTTVTSEQQKLALGLLGTDLSGHTVVIGYSAVGRSAVRELLAQDQKVAVIAEEAAQVPIVRALAREDRLYVTYGPPADREILLRANVDRAHSVIVCTADDAANMIAALNLRTLAPSVRVVASISRPELHDTVRAAGVTYVASPPDLGGRLCASAAFEPDVADAIDDLTQGDVQADLQEYLIAASSPLAGRSVLEAERLVREASGCLLVGYARADGSGRFAVRMNPPPGDPLQAGDAIVILGTVENAARIRRWLGVEQGR